MLLLPNDCSCSDPVIHPKNWNKAGASLKKKWYVQYYFYSDGQSKLCIVKSKLNQFHNLPDRREAAKAVLSSVIQLLKEGYNPITKTIASEITNEFDITKYTPWLAAIKKISGHLKIEQSTARDMKCYLSKIEYAAEKILVSQIPLCQLSRRHLKQILIHLEEKKKISAHAYNKCRTYLMMFFKELLEYDLIEFNPVRDISKRKTVKRLRRILTEDERIRINEHLKTNYYSFWRFMIIFFHSGARIKEMLALKVSDVDLPNQRFKILVKKGRSSREEYRVIKNIALPLWNDLLQKSKPTQFVFSIGLVPGPSVILREQITRRWSEHVKKKLGIDADFYSLKHLNLDEVSSALDIQAAARMAGHTTPVITLKHYAVGEKQRQLERLKQMENKFV